MHPDTGKVKWSRCTAWVLPLLLLAAAPVTAQPDPFEALAKASRVAVLPFSNYAEEPSVMPEMMTRVRAELERREVEQVDSLAVADALRRHRVRNTNELSVSQIQRLSDELAAAYLLVGSLERYVQAPEGGEVALSARLIYVPTVTIEWAGSASRHTLNGTRVLGLGREHDAVRLAHLAVKDLFQDFRYVRPGNSTRVESVKLGTGEKARYRPCERILAVPFANETHLYHAGGIVTNRILRALDRAGYTVVEPGRVREAMLEEGDMTQGRASADLLRICREQLGVGLILTGTVSEFDCATETGLNQLPAVAVEMRLVDTESGQVVWAKTVRSDGNDSNVLFGMGTAFGVASVADRVAARLVKSIPAHRVRKA